MQVPAVKTASDKTVLQKTAVSAGSTFYITTPYRVNSTAPVYTEPGAAAKQGQQLTAAAASLPAITQSGLQLLQQFRLQCVNLQIARLLFPFHHFW